MTKSKRKAVEKVLKQFTFVMWDRFVKYGKDHVCFYGWIARQDSHEDFLVVEYNDGEWWWITSSAAFDKDIKAIFGETTGVPCQRIQYHYEINNVIKLKKK